MNKALCAAVAVFFLSPLIVAALYLYTHGAYQMFEALFYACNVPSEKIADYCTNAMFASVMTHVAGAAFAVMLWFEIAERAQ